MNGIYYINEAAIGDYNPRASINVSDIFSCFGEAIKDGSISVIGVYGPLDEGFWDSMFSTYLGLASSIEAAIKDSNVSSVILAINSPGGAINGLFTLTDYIRKASEKKPIYAYIHGNAFSAAYAIAAACTKVYIASDAETGACGAYGRVMERDEEYLKKECGILQRVFRSKNAPKKNLSVISDEEAAKEFQSSVDKAGEDYISFVASCRGISAEKAGETFGRGAIVSAEYALQNGMVDRIGTPEELIEDISSRAEEMDAQGGGEDMDNINVSTMSTEERARIFGEIVALDPSLLSPAREEAAKNAAAEERKRIAALEALTVAGNPEIEALIHAAINDGRTAGEIGLECYEIMKKAREGKGSANGVLEALADDTQPVDVPQGEESVDALIDKALNKGKE